MPQVAQLVRSDPPLLCPTSWGWTIRALAMWELLLAYPQFHQLLLDMLEDTCSQQPEN